jgi:hypothetical protein
VSSADAVAVGAGIVVRGFRPPSDSHERAPEHASALFHKPRNHGLFVALRHKQPAKIDTSFFRDDMPLVQSVELIQPVEGL